SPLHSAPPRIASVCRPHQIACTPNASTSNPFTENTYLSQANASPFARDKGMDDCIQLMLVFQNIEWLGIRKRVIFWQYDGCGMGWRPGVLVNFPTFCVVEVILKLGAVHYLKSFFQNRLA
ncbi:hypothetical protein ACQUJT_22730, partial [Ralstonia pseudosolanacearum]